MTRWARVFGAAAARLRRRGPSSSAVAPQHGPSSAAAAGGGCLPAAAGPRRPFASLLAKMRGGRATRSSSTEPKAISGKQLEGAPPGVKASEDARRNHPAPPPFPLTASPVEPKRGPASTAAASKAAAVGRSAASPASSRSATSPASSRSATSPASSRSATSPASSRSATSPAKARRLSNPRLDAGSTGGESSSTPRFSTSTQAPSIFCSTSSPPPPLPTCRYREHGEQDQGRDQRSGGYRFDDFWYKITVIGNASVAFLYQVLKSDVDKEVDRKLKEKDIKDKEKLLLEKQTEIDKKEVEIKILEDKLKEKTKGWFF